MSVVATAGHVDHGKSTLVRALTGMEPDRWAEERRRGMTIDLGFAWTALPSGATVAFVDVPGHERFVSTMLAGIGPAPAVLFVVAADGGWMPQAAEHLAALHARDARHGVLAVTRADLADPRPALARARAELAATSLGRVEAVTVSGATGAGLDALRSALDRLVAALPPPDESAPVRLWVDRCFTIRGSGTVVTGTLGGGMLRAGDRLDLVPAGRAVKVRALQTMGQPRAALTGITRVAVNLRGADRDTISRGDALVTPGRFGLPDLIDVRVVGGGATRLPRQLTFHIGAAAVPAAIRALGDHAARVRLSRPLPLVIGDRALLRDPGAHAITGVAVLDVAPPPLTRRGAGPARAAVLDGLTAAPDLHGELRRRGLARRGDLVRMGVAVTAAPVAGDWLADPGEWTRLRGALLAEVRRYARAHPLQPGAGVEVLRHALGLPDAALVAALVAPPLALHAGRVTEAGSGGLPPDVRAAVDTVRADLAARPFAAPDADRLAALGLQPRHLAAAARAGSLLRITDTVVLLPDALDRALELIAALPQPFTLSQAREAMTTSRRVAVPLLEMLDRRGDTARRPDGRRTLTRSGPADAGATGG